MKFIETASNPSGAYPGLQSDPVPGLLAFPDEFLTEFYKADKQCAGFVTIQHDGTIVTSCTWNEEAYQAYITGLPEPEPAPPTTEERITALEADKTELNALTAAIEKGLSL